MVGIVAVTRFCEADSAKFSSYINYIDREEAVRKDNLDKFNIFDQYQEYMDDDTKTIIEGEQKTENVSALFTKEKDNLTTNEKKELKKVFQQAQTNGSNMWQTVISFDNEYLSELGIYDRQTSSINEKQLKQAARQAVTEMLKNEGLDNATWSASIHYNTDNIHIHIATVEPEPMREKRHYIKYEQTNEGKKPVLDENGKPVTYEAYKGTFKESSLKILKSNVRSELENNKEAYASITNLLRDNILSHKKKVNLLETPEFMDKMQELYNDLKAKKISTNKWQYNMNLIHDLKPKIDDLSDFFIDKYHRADFDEFLSKIEQEQARQTKAYGGTNNNYVENVLYGKEGLYARLGNSILRELRNYDKTIKEQKKETQIALKQLDPNSKTFDPSRGIAKLREQSDRGNSYAQIQMGFIYIEGKYTDRDINKAKEYFSKSAKNGNEYASKMLERIKDKGTYSKKRSFSYGSRVEFNKALANMKRSLSEDYINYINKQEAEELQKAIEMRGEDIYI